MERPNVPKFGNWENKEEVVPYTAYFDNARKGRGGKRMINPNDPEENPDLYGDMPRHNNTGRKSSMDDTSTHSNNNSNQHNREGSNNSTSTRPTRLSGGSEHSIDRSPLHPHYRPKAAGSGGVGSPARDSKSPLHSSQGNRTPGRSRMKPGSKDHNRNAERGGGAPIPKFGDWDENDPESAEEFTHIFNVASVEKQSGSSTPPPSYTDPSYNKMPKQKPIDQGCCCFAWLRKSRHA